MHKDFPITHSEFVEWTFSIRALHRPIEVCPLQSAVLHITGRVIGIGIDHWFNEIGRERDLPEWAFKVRKISDSMRDDFRNWSFSMGKLRLEVDLGFNHEQKSLHA